MAFDDVKDFKDNLVRKALAGAFFIAPMTTPALSTISSTGGALTIPTGYKSLGRLSTDGSELNIEQEVQAIRGWGDSAPVRRDVESETITLGITPMETKKNVLELMTGTDLSAVVANANNEVVINRPATPTLRNYRGLLLTKDLTPGGLEFYFGVHLPKNTFELNGGLQLQPGENPLQYPMTVNSLLDSTVGTAQRLFLAGPGMAELKADMGFVAA